MYNISKTYYASLLFAAKLLILGLASYLIYDKIWLSGEFNLLRQLSFQSVWRSVDLLGIILLLACSNWVFEVLKWKHLVSSIRPLEFREAAQQTLSSLTVSLITPNRLGEYGAKVAYYAKSERKHILLFNFLANMSQLLTTLLFGLIGLATLSSLNNKGFFGWSSAHLLMLAGGIIILLMILAIPMGKRFQKWLKDPNAMSKNSLLRLHGLSTLKYLAFSHQFYFLLLLFGAEQSYTVILPTLFLVYLVSSVIPGFLLFDWMVKGSVAVTLFGLAGMDELLVLSVTSLMWVMNFGIPSMIGAYHVMRFKRTNFATEKVEVR